MTPLKPRTSNPKSRVGFTLVELMISLAMMVVLMLAVNYIFSAVGKATSAAQTVSGVNRNVQAIQSRMFQDFNWIALPQGGSDSGPSLIIKSSCIAAFRNRKDELSDRDYDRTGTSNSNADNQIRTIDLNGDNLEDPSTASTNPEFIPRTIYGRRNFRVDQINFFARGAFPRQTGNDGTYIAPMSSNEAWIWYGHIKQPDASGNVAKHLPLGTAADGSSVPAGYTTPLTSQTNPNNFYATQWILGRYVMLLNPVVSRPSDAPPADPATGIWDSSSPPVFQVYNQRPASPTATSLAPLDQGSTSTDSAFQIQYSRYDLAGTSMQQFRSYIESVVSSSHTHAWYNGNHITYRFQGNPKPSKPLDSKGVGRTVPVFLDHCTQFVVEFAGDFVEQDPVTGLVQDVNTNGNAIEPDGVTDFLIKTDASGKKYRVTRWYGFPRDIDGDGFIPGWAAGVTDQNLLTDVVPLRDIIRTAPGMSASLGSPFERNVPTAKSNYASNAAPAPVALGDSYWCAWGPPTTYWDAAGTTQLPAPPLPQMIRILMTVDDPDGRLGDGVTYEYVFKIQ